MAVLDLATYLDRLDADLGRIGAVRPEDLDLEVAGCPGWDLARLVDHVGRVERMVLACLAAPDPEAFPGFPGRSGHDGVALVEWYVEGADRLRTALAAEDPDRVVATFLGPRPVAWWIRRQAHEHAVHRWDAQAAVGPPEPIESDLAVDGVTERLELWAARGGPPTDVAGSIHLHGTDAAGEWLIEVDDDGFRWQDGHHKGDVAVRGPVSDLNLLLWGRVPASRLEVLGDADLLDRLLAAG